MTGRWPALDYASDRAVIESCHAYLQVIGKLPTRALPWRNHGWHVALRVVPRGFRTYPVLTAAGEAEVLFDCLSGAVVLESSYGFSDGFELAGQTVAKFYSQVRELLTAGGVTSEVAGVPNEVDPAIPFTQDHRPRPWDHATMLRMHRAFSDANRVFEAFRTGFVGKSSPSHMFWGSFDLAVTRFSGRTAPLHPGGIANLPDRVTREAYSHEVASAGFWLGGNGVEEAAFYAYGYPAPPGIEAARFGPADAYWHEALGEIVFPYAAVRAAADPDAVLMSFLRGSYGAIADAGGWDRGTLEIPEGAIGRPYDVAAFRTGDQRRS